MLPFPYQKDFETDCQSLGYDDHTIESYRSNIRLFFEHVRAPPEDINNTHLNEFLRYLRYEKEIIRGKQTKIGASKSTIKTYFSSLHSFFDFLEYTEILTHNPIPKFRRRYLKHIKQHKGPDNTRQLISVPAMAQLVYTTLDPTERAIIMFLAKTGIRRKELILLDLDDIDLVTGIIYLKPTKKRSNRVVFIDKEGTEVLMDYLSTRAPDDTLGALFVHKGRRVSRNYVYNLVCDNAKRLSLHNPNGLLIKKFTPHCCRHWFTTHLIRARMSREHLQVLRGDVVKDAVDIYTHVDLEGLRVDFLDKIPQLGPAMLCPAATVDLRQPGRQTVLAVY
jgi:integrase/recombinase XerD